MITFGSFGPEGTTASLIAEAPKTGVMQFAFVDMGQGDCTLISCPNNRLYVIDCGSSGGLQEEPFNAAKALVRDWADGKSVYMVMTHPDKDHYNQFIKLLTTDPAVSVSSIYFSRAKSDSSPLALYKESGLGKNLDKFDNPFLMELTLNATKHFKKTWSLLADDYKTAIGPTDIPKEGYELIKGVAPKNIAWSLTIIAGNVTSASRTDKEKSNAASLCTLVKYGDQSLLMTADSNHETLKYLYDSHAAQIKNVSLFQVPHHGSETGTPATEFKALVDPEALVVSVGLLNDGFKLPRYSVIEEWKSGKRLGAADLEMDLWKVEMPGYDTFPKLMEIKDKKWAGYKIDNNNSKTFFWLSNPKDAAKVGTPFYGFTTNGYFLFRENWKKNIWMTGILGTLDASFFAKLAAATPSPPPPSSPDKEKRL